MQNQQTLRIIHSITDIGRPSFGVGPVALNLAQEQLSLGYDSHIWCMDQPDEVEWAASTSGYPIERIHAFTRRGPSALGYSPNMLHAATSLLGNATILHQHGIWMALSSVTNAWRRQRRRPTIVAPHGMLEAWALQRSVWKKRLALLAFEHHNLHSASCLHACSAQEVPGFRAFGLTNPIAIIPNGVPNEWLASSGDATQFRKRISDIGSRRILLFLSRIAPVKGLERLLAAVDMIRGELSDWMVIIAGMGDPGYRATIKNTIDRLDLNTLVTYVGPLFDQDKRDAYAAADLFILPTLRENFAVVIAEALGTGIPVITTKGAPWEDLVTHRCGWWTEISAVGIADALRDALLRPRAELQAMGQRGKELVASKYTWQHSAKMTEELYQWLLGHGNRPDFVLTE